MFAVLSKHKPSAGNVDLEGRSGFRPKDRVWVKRLETVGVVQEVRRCGQEENEYYLLQVALGDGARLNVLASPLAVEKWL
ncbi:MAG: hypothetical protein JO069_00740 [Verrucomicrobia bacterium]|nr:hypothetical protein [Verrucomicrobiota bacterium]